MAEQFPSDTTLNALSGTADGEQAVPYVPVGLSPYHTEFYKMLYRLLDVARRAGDLRVYKDDSGALKFGVRPGRWLNGDTPVNYPGASGQSLTDNATNTIYLTAAGVLTVNTTGLPNPSTTPHIPLATIATGTASAAGVAGQYDHADITDYRGRALVTVAAGLTGAEVAEAAAFFAATDLTGAEAETLSSGTSSNADALHTHNGKANVSHTHDDKLNKALTSANLFVGNASNVAAGVGMSGDATISNSGALTIAAGAVTDAKVNASAAIAGSKLQALSVGNNAGVLPSTGVADAHVAASAAIARSKLAAEAAARYRIPLMSCRRTSGDTLGSGYGAGYYGISSGNWGDATLLLQSIAVTGTTETTTLIAEFILSPEYVAGGNLSLVVRVKTYGSGTRGTATVDAQVYKLDGSGTGGSDLCATNAQNYDGTFTDYPFVLTGSGLAPGDHLKVFIQTVIQETGGTSSLKTWISNIELQMSIKG